MKKEWIERHDEGALSFDHMPSDRQPNPRSFGNTVLFSFPSGRKSHRPSPLLIQTAGFIAATAPERWLVGVEGRRGNKDSSFLGLVRLCAQRSARNRLVRH